MTAFDIIMLALIQGITEFLPISSSGHLVLWPLLTGRPDQGVTMDVAVHLGALVAVCGYFRTDVVRLLCGTRDLVHRRGATEDARLARLIGVATLPALAVGAVLKVTGWIEALRLLEVIGWATLLCGILLWAGDRFGRETRIGDGWTTRDALAMGLAQALALVPGTSRSGITMAMARALGFRRDEAARLSLLMAVPIILFAAGAELYTTIRDGNLEIGLELALGAALSCAAAWGALLVMMRMFRADWTMTPFVLYRLALGTILLGLAYS